MDAGGHQRQVVVDGQEAYLAAIDPRQRGFQPGQVMRLEAQVHMVLRAKGAAHALQAVEHALGVSLAAQAAFPR
ncbi:hypothetical protein OR16_40509 [Cupriavidus basilensis OR16]|uniref:Uncharacterized protein n=1 Tax=Cupriavidus basilensis OR16 TaxID=1127483 RepID=H1SHZ7_9BURK|nr:hypothetical protein OR16_40509 [Cupriavidus basilensis OR16]